MKYKIALLLSFFFYENCDAHNPNEAFFKIKETQNTVEISAEFPWTLRCSLLMFSPKLRTAKSQQEFEAVFVEYIKKNLILTDKDGKKMLFRSFKELKNDGHSHGNSYLLTFEGKNVTEISNTIMFEISDKQINYHTIEKKGNSFETNPKQPSLVLNSKTKFSYWYFLILPPLIFYYFYLRTQNRKP